MVFQYFEEIILEENFSELLEKSLVDFKYKEGQVVKGTVLSVTNDTVVVDVGLKSEGENPIKRVSFTRRRTLRFK